MTGRSIAGITPQQRIAAECARRGKAAVVADCIALVQGGTDLALLTSVGGNGAAKYFDGAVHHDTYWFRVWGLRGLLWSWDPIAGKCVCAALADESWRVREMAAKVVAKHLVNDAFATVTGLRDDPIPRVCQAAERALRRLADAEA